ncbi:AI-2E family transporter [Streptomyces sp. ODS28]|uniref:AI-2E family transporter n=1 Tax=Streptomyces sp. ODS28 TaxID=3136688 RepID=UPI0031ECCDEC
MPPGGARGGRPPGGPHSAQADDRESRMPRWLPRAFVLALALLGCFQLGTWAFHQVTGLLLNILISFFLALAIEPPVDKLASYGMRRGFATALVFLALFVLVAGFFGALGSVFAEQVTRIVDNLPSYVQDVVVWINKTFHTKLSVNKLQDNVLHSDWLRNYVQENAEHVWGWSATVLGTLFQLLTICLFSFYFAADGPRLRRALCSVLPPNRQAEVLRAWEIAVAKTGGYIYSRALMALVSGFAHYLFLQWLGVPYAPALGVWVGVVSQFIPTVGTYLAGALPILLAFTVEPWAAVWVLVFVVVYQQFENYILQPRITAKTVDIHPAVAFGSVIAGTALMGVVGALIAIPATATLQGFLGAYVKRYDVTDPSLRVAQRRGVRGLWRRRRGHEDPDESGSPEAGGSPEDGGAGGREDGAGDERD